jgi:hypothetical protein
LQGRSSLLMDGRAFASPKGPQFITVFTASAPQAGQTRS